MKPLNLQGVEPVKTNVIDDVKALAKALRGQAIELVGQHKVEAGVILGAVFLMLVLATANAFTSPQVSAGTLTPAIENMVRQDCAGILNAKGVTNDGKVKACQALASQYSVKLKGITE
jgi:hypothetical protein